MKSVIHKAIFCLGLLAFLVAALPSAAQLPAFKPKNTDACLRGHHFTEQDLLMLTKKTYPNVKNQLNADGNGVGYFAWKTISHANVGLGINTMWSFPSEVGMSFQPKKMFGSTFPGSERIGKFLNGFGAVVIMGQLVEDISTDNPQLQINLGKNTAYWVIGASKLFSSAMKISSIAVQIFDYTLNQLGTTALNGQKHLWYTAYANYFDTEYGHHVSDMPKWDRLIEKHGGNMNTALKEMHKEFWEDDFRASFKKQKYIWSNADPSEAVKIEVRDTYLQGMLPTLTNYYRKQEQNARNAAVRKANSIYNDMVEFMNREIAFRGTITSASGLPLAGVKVSLYGIHPVISNAKGEYRMVFRMCELIPELGKSNNKILATAYYTPDPAKPPRVKQLSRGLGVGFMSQSDQIDSVQDRLDFSFKTDDWVQLTIRPGNVEMEGEAVTNLTAVCRKDDGTQMDVTHDVEWHSDKPAIAVVTDGRLMAQKTKGSANITVSSIKPGRNLISGPCMVFVKFQREVNQLTIQPTKIEIQSNSQAPIKAVALFNDGQVKNVTIDPECKWVSTPPNLQVTPQGRLKAGKAVWGKPKHTLKAQYTFKGKTVTASIPVRLLSSEKATKLTLNKPEVTMGLNENVGLRVTALIGKGTATFPVNVTTQVVWTVSDKTIITQTAGGVIVSGSKEGYCGVKAEYRPPNSPALQVICKVTVVDKNRPLPPPDFSIHPEGDPLPMGQPVTFRSRIPASSKDQLDLIWYVDGKEIPDRAEITHTFTSPGTYSVRLFIQDRITGKNDAVPKNVHIQSITEEQQVSIVFSPKTNIYKIDSTVEFIAKTKKVDKSTTYRWYVSGEFIGEGAKGVEHTFKEDGQFEIKLGLRRGSNFDEEKIIRTLTVGEAGIGTLGRLRNRFVAKGGTNNLEIQSQYYRGGSGDWSELIRFNGGRTGPVDHFIHYDGDQQDGWNTGFLFYVPQGKNELHYKLFHFRWPANPKVDLSPRGIVHDSGWLNLHNKTLIPDSVNFARKASRLCIVEWRTEDGSSCRARIGKFSKTVQDAMSGVKDLGCEADVYPPIEDKVDTPPDPDVTKDEITEEDEPDVTLGERLVSGTYRVEARVGQMYTSPWTLSIVNGDITGTSKWTCCPGPRTDPLIGFMDGDSVTITRDCTGQGYSGPCSQIYTGTLNGDVIEGSFTLNERSNFGTWTLYLNSKEDPSLTDSSQTDTGTQSNGSDPSSSNNENGETTDSENGALGGGGPGSGITDLEGVPDGGSGGLLLPDGSTGTGTAGGGGSDGSLTNGTGETGPGTGGGMVTPSGQTSGLWRDKNGHCIYIQQDGDHLVAEALENNGPVGWKRVKGKVQDGEVSILFNNRVEFAKLASGGAQIRWNNGSVWSLFNASPSAADIEEHSWQQRKVAGLWTDLTGNQIRLTQNGNELIATALENKGPVGWKTTKGKLSWGTMSFLWFSRVYFGKVSEDENSIVWGKDSVWKRNSPAGSDTIKLIGDQKKNMGGIPGSVSGNWAIQQGNGFTGKLHFFQDSSGGLTGNANFGQLQGKLTGTLSGQTVTFTIHYPDGLEGHYTGTLSADGTRIENGSSKASNGGSATWSASRPSSSKIKPVITGLGMRKQTR
jgi:PKD domain